MTDHIDDVKVEQTDDKPVEQPVKKRRGRPRVVKPPKQPKINGRPKIYPTGSRDPLNNLKRMEDP